MAQAGNTDVVDDFEEFYRTYYRDEIGELARKYPSDQRSLYVSWQDLYRYDAALADDVRQQPDQFREYAEEALRLYDLPVDVSLGQAHVRIEDLPDTVGIREIRAHHRGQLVAVRGIIRKATDVRPKVQEAAFECQRCGTLTRIPQTGGEFQEPHECQGCERQGPFRINYDQSEFVDAQKLRVQESPEGLRGGETPQNIDVHIEDDVTGEVTAGDHVRVTGVLHLDQQESGQRKSSVFDVYIEGWAVEIEDEQFEDMAISEDDKKDIVELSNDPDIYDRMVDSMAPSIYGYEDEKLAIILQLFSGVTKHLPDESRVRGDLHILLIGDPGTGKCQKYDTDVVMADGRERKLGALVEEHLTDPVPVDDGVYQNVDFDVQSIGTKTTVTTERATRVWKRRAPDRMIRVRTMSGRELVVTPSHPLFAQDDGELTAVRADELDTEEFLAVPRQHLPGKNNNTDVSYQEIDASGSNTPEIPSRLTEELARLLGYIVGEGYVTNNDSNATVTITNGDEEVLNDASACFESLGLRYSRRPHYTRDTADIILCSSGEFVDFLHNLEAGLVKRSAQQRVPDPIARASLPIKRAFLRAYVDGEAHVSASQREITVASMSRELLEGVRSLLLSFGIQTSVHPRENGSFRLRIGGADFERYVEEIGFVTERKSSTAETFDGTEGNTNTDVIPNVGDELRRIREALALTQHDCGVARTTYQHYERGDRNPGRESLRAVVEAFEERLGWLQRTRERLVDGDWSDVEAVRDELNLSQATLAKGTEVGQRAISYYEREGVAPDGGVVADVREVVLGRVDEALSVTEDVAALRDLVDGDLAWDRIESIEAVDPDDDWVYDLEVEGTHTYISNGVVSHNSQLLQYVRKISPRSVYTSGKGSSSAGLCVTGDTRVQTGDGIRPIREIVEEDLPDPVEEETASEKLLDIQTFDRDAGEMVTRSTSLAWRMPEKPCRRIETAHGKELEASENTPVLTCGEDGMAWTPISDVSAGDHVAVARSDDASPVARNDRTRERAHLVVEDVDPGAVESVIKDEEAANADLRWDEVVATVDTGHKEVFDLTVPETHNFVANGVVTHNTAAAVQDDFGEGQQWTLEAGALVLADQGIAAIDELDKMTSEDRSAMHEALEQQTISISKAGINATLKSRCSLLGAANPKYGRFDEYEAIAEQIDLEPALISRFDIIFTVTDEPDPEDDRALAEHIIGTNYAGELNTHRVENATSNVSEEEVRNVTEDVEPPIDPELLRKYIAYAKRSCFPIMTEGAKERIEEFYVDLREQGTGGDAPIPVTARKLEALVRLAEASARVRLSDTVNEADADRVIEIVRASMEDIGMDPETGEFDADIVETGTSKSQRDRIRNIKAIIQEIEEEYDDGAPIDEVLERAEAAGMERSKAEGEIEKLRRQGDVYEPRTDHLRTV